VVDAHGNGKSANRLAVKLGDGVLEGLDFQFNELDDLSLGRAFKKFLARDRLVGRESYIRYRRAL
jgi:hypothetical protein